MTFVLLLYALAGTLWCFVSPADSRIWVTLAMYAAFCGSLFLKGNESDE